ncbi:type I restriction/modification system, specificity subunit [Aliarcobacter cibarius]|uniref:restriction endonuclease subunit S n=1 Tax=Aliarcobacter cibarius TaxID=255507 RepID=UPI0012442CFB|nr:restriction endonuclease subunit S [Aliarcobacter cibarius]QEZ89344.1 type I restriction/modification system, specificity subunit [Aliarcobacter cibarius]
MSNLPKGWESVELGSVCKINGRIGFRGYTVNDLVERNQGGAITLSPSNIIGNKLDLSKCTYISDFKYEESPEIKIFNGDIILVKTASIGKTALVENLLEKATLNPQLVVLKDIKINNVFLSYIISSLIIQKQIKQTSGGGVLQTLSQKQIAKYIFPLPPLEEQKKIADILSTVDKKIAFVEENINATEELKKGLMQKLLTEGIGHTEFKDSELGRIHESWEVVQFDKVCDIRDGTHDSPKYIESGIPFITSKHLTDNGIDFTETNYISKENHIEFSKRSKVDNGDILFGMIGTIGKPIIVNTDFEFSIKNIALLKLSCNELLSNIYVLNLLKSNIITKQFSKLSNGGVQSFIALGMIRKLKIPLPPLEEQKQIAEILSTVDNKLENLKEKKQSFEELKKGLMQKLLTGEIRV